MNTPPLKLVVLGLSLSSSWGNGHATTYRALLREFAARGHEVLFLERDVPWYAAERDLTDPPYCQLAFYAHLDDLRDRFAAAVREADVVLVGSYVPEGLAAGEWVLQLRRGLGPTAFYDIDTPVTLGAIARGQCAYLDARLLARYDLYLSFSGGPNLARLARQYGIRRACPLYCSVDPAQYFPEPAAPEHDLGYMGTYSADRQPALERLLLAAARGWPAGRFIVAGPQYPAAVSWPANVTRIEHLPPAGHRAFYNAQRFTLNLTRAEMIRFGWSPSVRLFEAAACGVPIISDAWPGLEQLFQLNSGRPELLISHGDHETLEHLRLPERERERIGRRARRRILAEHTATHRAEELEQTLAPLLHPLSSPRVKQA